jgi:hypothetical protein
VKGIRQFKGITGAAQLSGKPAGNFYLAGGVGEARNSDGRLIFIFYLLQPHFQ